MSATRAITLPHGLLDGDRRRSKAVLRLPTGADEAALHASRGRSRAEQVTELLARCTTRIDDIEVDQDVARALTVGDREALLLQLRASLFGDRLSCVVECPECGAAMDVDLHVSDLLLPPYDDVSQRHTVALADGLGDAELRLVTGADQEAAARSGGVEELLARCVLNAEATPAFAEAVSRALLALDPQAEITIDVVCPSCDEPVSALVDAAGILLAELTDGDDRLLREVDALARTYHWSEAEILGLDVQRRQRYLELLTEEVEAP